MSAEVNERDSADGLLSVVVTVVDGGEALARCLTALGEQAADVALEVIVPWDASVAADVESAGEASGARFLALGELPTGHAPESATAWHERIDRRRAAGLSAARGDVVALLEDRGAPLPGWARGVVAAHRRLPHAAIGGGVDFTGGSRWAWAAFEADFGRYRPPVVAGPRHFLTDVNVSYKRRALEATRDLWRERYHETTVHWALARAGEILHLSDEFIVEQRRRELPLRALLAERAASGRLFAATRARESALPERLARAAFSPILPAVLVARALRHRRRGAAGRRPPRGTAMALFALTAAWSAGELAGYLTARG